jgi:hypothetical protein
MGWNHVGWQSIRARFIDLGSQVFHLIVPDNRGSLIPGLPLCSGEESHKLFFLLTRMGENHGSGVSDARSGTHGDMIDLTNLQSLPSQFDLIVYSAQKLKAVIV